MVVFKDRYDVLAVTIQNLRVFRRRKFSHIKFETNPKDRYLFQVKSLRNKVQCNWININQ